MGEEKYSPDYVKMELANVQWAAKAAKNMTNKRFKRFEADMQEAIDGGRYVNTPFVRNLSTRCCGSRWSSTEATLWR